MNKELNLDSSEVIKAGFVGIIGRTNAGKSTLLNTLVGENLALISHKQNATRTKMNFIVPYTNKQNEKSQIIFVDTPGLHKKEKFLNKFMIEVALKVMNDCDLCVFVAAFGDDLKQYREFLDIYKKKHILLINKIDKASKEAQLKEIQKYAEFSENFYVLIPISAKSGLNLDSMLEEISKLLPKSPALFDEELLTNNTMREIVKELIRESIFMNLSDELPYESDVLVTSYKTDKNLTKIQANIYVKKNSQKIIFIGKNGETIKRIGIVARKKIENLIESKVFLKLNIIVDKDFGKDLKNLKKFGYNDN